VAVTVMQYVPSAPVDATERVMAFVVPTAALMGLGLIVTPEGCPVAVNVSAEVNAPIAVVLMLTVADVPRATESGDGEAVTEKSVGIVSVKTAAATWLVVNPVAVAMALIVVVFAIGIFAAYFAEDVLGTLPSVV
jgi:hypothetical protein